MPRHLLTMRRWLMLTIMVLMSHTTAHAGLFDLLSPGGSIHFPTNPRPDPFFFGVDDFTFATWFRRTTDHEGASGAFFNFNEIIHVTIDDDAGGIRVVMFGDASTIDVLVPVEVDGTVPLNEWILFVCTFDASEGTLTLWSRSESTPPATASATDAAWISTGFAWPLVIGSDVDEPRFVGQLGMSVVRDHIVNETDVDALWTSGRYFDAAMSTDGSFTGLDGLSWMIGHGYSTIVQTVFNQDGVGASIGETMHKDNLMVWLPFGGGNYYAVGNLDAVTGTWVFRNLHSPTATWADFFTPQVPDLGLPRPHFIERIAPATRHLAMDEPEGLVRVLASANSRGVRTTMSYGRFENWGIGGLYESRQSSVAGIILPALEVGTSYPFFRGIGRIDGDAADSRYTTRPSIAFGNFGSHGAVNPAFPNYGLAGRCLVIEDGSAWIPKARPEAWTLMPDATTPLVVRTLMLRFPGSGDVVQTGEKAATQLDDGTLIDDPAVIDLDTTVYTHTLATDDVVDPFKRRLALVGKHPLITAGDACYISDGTGAGGISLIESVDSSSELYTVVVLEKWFPVDPVAGDSTVKLGPAETTWVDYHWDGLDARDPETYRGHRLTASGGIVVAMFTECHRPDVDGFIVGGVGKSGSGYQHQLGDLFQTGGVRYMAAIQPDVWLQFFAHQGATAPSMGQFAEVILGSTPQTELWWCGDPDFDLDTVDVENTDDWHAWILDNAEAFGVGAVTAFAHPTIGFGPERALQGHIAGPSHVTGIGNTAYMDATLDMLADAALPAETCAADCGMPSDGQVDILDLLHLLGLWGLDGTCDLTGPTGEPDGVVGILDLLQLLGEWSCSTP